MLPQLLDQASTLGFLQSLLLELLLELPDPGLLHPQLELGIVEWGWPISWLFSSLQIPLQLFNLVQQGISFSLVVVLDCFDSTVEHLVELRFHLQECPLRNPFCMADLPVVMRLSFIKSFPLHRHLLFEPLNLPPQLLILTEKPFSIRLLGLFHV